ncbi:MULTISPECIES: substrate-binding domain-containing protein [Variovorax]|uniref:substrate-binding domain-containing protein n=1 Tax=Variovorax TaxID=34072 RepID=UPI0003770A1B|nr:substrate-binding domain-containing protein [Variovorax paradoxus]
MNVAIRVLAPQAFQAPLYAVGALFEQAAHVRVEWCWGPAGGPSPQALVQRLERGEAADVVLLPAALLAQQVQAGRVEEGSRTDVMRSRVGACVAQDQPPVDIGSAQALRRAIVQARGVAYSQAGSGIYISQELFGKLGIEPAQVRVLQVRDEPVAAAVARGDAELGFQQISEILGQPGVRFAGALPDDLQHVTVIGAGMPAGAAEPEAARRFMQFLRSHEAAGPLADAGLDPCRG